MKIIAKNRILYIRPFPLLDHCFDMAQTITKKFSAMTSDALKALTSMVFPKDEPNRDISLNLAFPFSVYFYNLSGLSDCTCKSTKKENGNGICQTRDSNFDGLLSCVVNQPSSCEDLVNSTTNSEEQLSAEACAVINQGNMLLYGFKHTYQVRK